jgi:HD domain
VWQKPQPLTADEWKRVRLHACHSERILSRSPFLAALTTLAGVHHERLDGSGYHRAAAGASLPPAARVLAAAGVYHAMTEPRLTARRSTRTLPPMYSVANRALDDSILMRLAWYSRRVASPLSPRGLATDLRA